MATALWRIATPEGPRLARGPSDEGPRDLLAGPRRIADLLAAGRATALADALNGRTDGPVPGGVRVLVPVDDQPVWAAGVTYLRSREARREEAVSADPYDRVYDADRPELFFKALPGTVRGPGEAIGIRADSGWDVPEPELGLVIDAAATIVGYVVGNDVSSRSIEGENALYLPQAKTYTGSCALGPCLVPVSEAVAPADMRIRLQVHRHGRPVVQEEVAVAELHRGLEELVWWLTRALAFPHGVILLTGTAVVPDPDFTLRPADEVSITITGLGTLINVVEVVGRQERGAGPRSMGLSSA